MSKQKRLKLIRDIQKARNSYLIALICSDRQPVGGPLDNKTIRPLYDHLRAAKTAGVDNIDLFLYSVGGPVDVPWRLVSKIRECCKRFNILIPYKAHSAATMIALGADSIIMTATGELGPIDPILSRAGTAGPGKELIREDIPVEDVLSFIDFLRERVGLTDQSPLASNLDNLTKNLPPHLIGGIYRIHMHTRLVARKMLTMKKPPHDEDIINNILDTLVEKTYFHGHGIGRREAHELGLQIKNPDEALEANMWELFCLYEDLMGLNQIFDVESAIPDGKTEHTEPNWNVVTIESEHKTQVFSGELRLRRVYQMPQQLNIPINLSFNLPPDLNQQPIQQQLQPVIKQISQQLDSQMREAILRQIRALVPSKLEVKFVNPSWQELAD